MMTYQGLVATDFNRSFVIFIYNCKLSTNNATNDSSTSTDTLWNGLCSNTDPDYVNILYEITGINITIHRIAMTLCIVKNIDIIIPHCFHFIQINYHFRCLFAMPSALFRVKMMEYLIQYM